MQIGEKARTDSDSSDQENQEEINFDQLLGDAAQSQAEYDEDRDDSLDDDEDTSDQVSLSYSKTGNEIAAEIQKISLPKIQPQ